MCKQKLRTIFCILCIIVLNKSEIKLKTLACMPRASLRIGGKPFLWNLFGNNNDDTDIDETSRELDETLPANEKINWSTVSDFIFSYVRAI